MAQKVKRDKKAEDEERELEEFIAARKKARASLVKKVLIIVVCIGLVFAFCLPAVSMLF